ncbi:MAG: ATP-binding protein [Bacteroidetes bacterium]|nr:ATP-binding protein [Bacteroidota bacterium]
MLKKIVIIGPESTGKSTLCELLAQYYQTQWVPEFAREYLLRHGKDYSFEDLLTIAKGQLALEDKICAAFPTFNPQLPPTNSQFPIPKNPIFIDTDMYVMKVWCEFVFGKCHQWIINEIAKRKYDLYLLCNTDLPWVKDELREYPDFETRGKLFRIYKDILVNQSTPWVEISGNPDERMKMALEAVGRLIS